MRTLHSPNSLMIPRPLPDSIHRFLTVPGRVYLPKVLSCNWALCRTSGASCSFLATERYARRATSFARTPCRALISRRTLALNLAMRQVDGRKFGKQINTSRFSSDHDEHDPINKEMLVVWLVCILVTYPDKQCL